MRDIMNVCKVLTASSPSDDASERRVLAPAQGGSAGPRRLEQVAAGSRGRRLDRLQPLGAGREDGPVPSFQPGPQPVLEAAPQRRQGGEFGLQLLGARPARYRLGLELGDLVQQLELLVLQQRHLGAGLVEEEVVVARVQAPVVRVVVQPVLRLVLLVELLRVAPACDIAHRLEDVARHVELLRRHALEPTCSASTSF